MLDERIRLELPSFDHSSLKPQYMHALGFLHVFFQSVKFISMTLANVALLLRTLTGLAGGAVLCGGILMLVK
jgi:hypothetical protein